MPGASYVGIRLLLLVNSRCHRRDPLAALLQIFLEIIVQKVAMLLFIVPVPNDGHVSIIVGADARLAPWVVTRMEDPRLRRIHAAHALGMRVLG